MNQNRKTDLELAEVGAARFLKAYFVAALAAGSLGFYMDGRERSQDALLKRLQDTQGSADVMKTRSQRGCLPPEMTIPVESGGGSTSQNKMAERAMQSQR